ncbi:MAG: hypothetical protein WC655_28465 [Candidatus Hydrogenedentales bacterium]|jgi:hypothetical protein
MINRNRRDEPQTGCATTMGDSSRNKRNFMGIVVLIVAYASIMPLLHAWITWRPPHGMTPTGMHHSDTVVFIHCMRMFDTGFYTPFASCNAPLGDHSVRYFATPFYWIYGLIGELGGLIHANEMLALGVANGCAAAIYLFAVYVFFRAVAPRQANLGFVLFVLGGGLGGLAYLVAGALGLHGHERFDTYFQWFTLSLVEGNANVKMPRLYYTLPLAMGLFGLALLVRSACRKSLVCCIAGGVLIGAGAFFNARLAPLFLGTGVLYLWLGAGQQPVALRAKAGVALLLGVLAGGVPGVLATRLSPTFYSNAFSSVRDSLSLGAFVLDTLPLLFVAAIEVWRTRSHASTLGRVALASGAGYVVSYALLYAVYHTYFGTWLIVHDYGAPIAVSDWALLGAGAGAIWALLRKSGPLPFESEGSGQAWIGVWFLAFLALAITAFGAGWFMRFTPSRIHCMLGLPLALLAAAGIQRLRERTRAGAHALATLIVTCGISTTLVSALCFMGPLGWKPGSSPFAYIHGELMTDADASVIAQLPPGRVLTEYTPGPQVSDIISLRPGNCVVIGMGTMNMSDLNSAEMAEAVAAFFKAGAPDDARRAFVRKWRVDYIFCSDTHVEDDAVEQELRGTRWLRVVNEKGGATLFRVEPG